MGYESRLYIVKARKSMDYAEIIARFDCLNMGYGNGWRELFNKSFNCDMYADDGNTPIKEDCYGDELKYADFPTVITWLEKEVEKSDYRRLKLLLSLLKGFDLTQCPDGDMQIVHYGY